MLTHPNIRITRVPEDKKTDHEKIPDETTAENFPQMGSK